VALRCSLGMHLGSVSAIRATRGRVLLYQALLRNNAGVLWRFLWRNRPFGHESGQLGYLSVCRLLGAIAEAMADALEPNSR